MKRIILIITLVLLVVMSLVFIGFIGANLNFDELSIEVISFKHLFLGITKIVPLIFFVGSIMLIQKEIK